MREAAHRRVVGGAFCAVAVMIGVSIGCEPDTTNVCDPALWDGIQPDPVLCGYPDAGDAGDAGDADDTDAPPGSCTGACVPLAPNGWDAPELVWFGPELGAPPCPATAAQLGYEGHADLFAPNVCGECHCDAPTGSCDLPATLTVSSSACPGNDPGVFHTPFDPPTGWDGSCTSSDAIPAGALCNGVPCVQSLTIAPLTIDESGCTPTQLPIPADGPATWGTFARACEWEPHGQCPGSGQRCAPKLPPGFRYCIFQRGDLLCPDPNFGPYQERHVLYAGFEDTRSCSPCTCGPPAGSTCTAEVSIFADAACSTVPTYMESIDATKAACLDLISGAPLLSKSSKTPTYVPGECQPSGGQPMGSTNPLDPGTLCCIPAP